MKDLYYYLRDKMGRPVVTVCLLVEGDKIARGVAICSEKDMPEKRKGRGIALERAMYAMVRLQRTCVIEGVRAADLRIKRGDVKRVLSSSEELMLTPWTVLTYKAIFNPVLTDMEHDIIAKSIPLEVAA